MLRIVLLSIFLVSCGDEHYTQVINSEEVCNNPVSEESSSDETGESLTTDDPIAGQLKIHVCKNTTETE
jgi:hypothetical protein